MDINFDSSFAFSFLQILQIEVIRKVICSSKSRQKFNFKARLKRPNYKTSHGSNYCLHKSIICPALGRGPNHLVKSV